MCFQTMPPTPTVSLEPFFKKYSPVDLTEKLDVSTLTAPQKKNLKEYKKAIWEKQSTPSDKCHACCSVCTHS